MSPHKEKGKGRGQISDLLTTKRMKKRNRNNGKETTGNGTGNCTGI